MKKLFIMVILSLLISINVLAAGNEADIKETVISVAHVAIEGQYHPYNEGLKVMQEVLDRETGGKIKLKIYAGGSLVSSESEMLTMIKDGSLDMAIIVGAMSTYEPMISLLGLPYIFKSIDHVEEVMLGEVGHIFQEKFEEKGFTILSWWIGKGARSLVNSIRPIYKPEDLKGMKIRVIEDPVAIDIFKEFDMVPVPISWGELHTALQTKTVDAFDMDPQVVDKYGFVEFAPYYSLTEHQHMPIAVIISSTKLNSLGEKGKEIIFKAADVARLTARDVADKTVEESYQGIEEQGGEVNEVENIEDFQNVCLPVIAKYREKFGENGAHIIELILNNK
jgi:TRAP-type transport system periplasmic protein